MKKIEITHVGSSGDGVGMLGEKRAFVPFSLTGETVEVDTITARSGGIACALMSIENPSKSRAKPSCKHFGKCGGCKLQHMEEKAYKAWKMNMVQEKMNRENIDIPLQELLWETPNSRRRAVFHFAKKEGEIICGFHEAYSDEIIEISECAIVRPALFEAAMKIKNNCKALIKVAKKFSVLITEDCDGHVDVCYNIQKEPTARMWKNIGEIDSLCAFSRSGVVFNKADYEIVSQNRPLNIRFGEKSVPLPGGAFSQATFKAEHVMQSETYEALKGCKNIADLFAGCGTFTLPFLETGTDVTSVDLAYESIRSLANATAGKNVTTQIRNLFTQPLAEDELNTFDGVIIDPPRAGAKAQCKLLANSCVPKVVMISCDISSFVRDARILIDGGYAINSAKLIDQFIWSPHGEIISVYSK